MPARVLLAGLFHETHTFLAEKTTLADCTIVLGDDLLTPRGGNGSPLAGFLEVAREHDWQVRPTIDLRAMPGGMVEEAVFEYFWTEFAQRAAVFLREGVDAIFLVLHGAGMASERHPDVEGELLARIRQALPRSAGSAPVRRARPARKRFPAHGGARKLPRRLPPEPAYGCPRDRRAGRPTSRPVPRRGRLRPHSILRRLPILWAPPGTGTARDPMLSLVRKATQAGELDPSIWAVSVAPGFSFADTPDTGVSILVSGTADDAHLAAYADALARLAWDSRELGQVTYPDVDTVLRRILPVTAGPVLLVEPSDNIGGGAPGDGTGILRALVRHDVPDALVIINDPLAVRDLQSVSPGGTTTLSLGGRGSSLDPGPVTLEVTLVSRSNGRFDLEDIHSHLASMLGRHIAMGDCAVVRHRGLTILLTSKNPAVRSGPVAQSGNRAHPDEDHRREGGGGPPAGL